MEQVARLLPGGGVGGGEKPPGCHCGQGGPGGRGAVGGASGGKGGGGEGRRGEKAGERGGRGLRGGGAEGWKLEVDWPWSWQGVGDVVGDVQVVEEHP